MIHDNHAARARYGTREGACAPPAMGTTTKHPPIQEEGRVFVKIGEADMRSVTLRAGVVEIGFETKLGWEFGESVGGVHFDAVIGSAALIGWFEGAAIGGAGEGEEFVETIANATQSAACAVHSAVGIPCFAAVCIGFADDLLGDLDDAVEDVADGTSELALSGVLGSGRCLNVRGGGH